MFGQKKTFGVQKISSGKQIFGSKEILGDQTKFCPKEIFGVKKVLVRKFLLRNIFCPKTLLVQKIF